MFSFIRGFYLGVMAVFSFPASPIYRYPYYFPGEALRGDWQRIGKDVTTSFEQEEAQYND